MQFDFCWIICYIDFARLRGKRFRHSLSLATMALLKEGTLVHNLLYTDASITTAFCKRGFTLIGEGFRSERPIPTKLAEIVLKTVAGLVLAGTGITLFVVSFGISGLMQFGWLAGSTSGENRYKPSGASHLPRQGRHVKYKGKGNWVED